VIRLSRVQYIGHCVFCPLIDFTQGYRQGVLEVVNVGLSNPSDSQGLQCAMMIMTGCGWMEACVTMRTLDSEITCYAGFGEGRSGAGTPDFHLQRLVAFDVHSGRVVLWVWTKFVAPISLGSKGEHLFQISSFWCCQFFRWSRSLRSPKYLRTRPDSPSTEYPASLRVFEHMNLSSPDHEVSIPSRVTMRVP
jgi:hypothetical protein